MEIRNLNTFIRVAELRNFSKAAQELGYSQSTVSTQINQLESELNTSLFDRIGRTTSLTPAGIRFLDYAHSILRMTSDAKKQMQKLPMESGELRIAMAESLCISLFPSILKEYHRLYPQVNLIIQTGKTDEMFRMLMHNETDLIYTLDHRIFQPDLVMIEDVKEPVCFVVSTGHELAGQKSLYLQDLIKYPFILTERRMSYRYQFDNLLASRQLELTPCLELGNTEVIKQLVLEGVGLTLLPHFVVKDELAAGSLIMLKVADAPIEIWRQLIYHKRKWVTPPMQAMIEMIR